ncbi:hypothetical protein pb186bvf_012529 [Paramecium bursaria]
MEFYYQKIMEKNPVDIVKKKLINDTIMYKIRWSNGSITLDALYHMNQQCLKLVNDYEVRLWNNPNIEEQNEPQMKKNVKLNQVTQQISQSQFAKTEGTSTQQNGDYIRHQKPEEKSQKSIQNQSLNQKNAILIQQDSDQQATPKGHKKRQNKPIKIKSLRQNQGRVEFMVEEDGWVDVDELKAKSPISLCEFLLSKVKIQTPIASKK